MKIASQRGSALIIAIIVITVVTIIGAGVIRFASRATAGATAGAREQSLVSCAETARQLLLSKFHILGTPPTSVQALNVPLDAPSGGQTFAVGGHIDTQNVTVAQVAALDPTRYSGGMTGDLTNIIGAGVTAHAGGVPLKVVVHCNDHGRQLEVEFALRYGL